MKKKILWSIAILFVVLVGGSMYALRPKCAPIADEALGHFSIPIEERTDRDFFYLKVFQKKDDGHWYQCKTALSRAFFM